MTKINWVKQVKFDAVGLIPAVIQDAKSKQVLMVAYMNSEALLKTLKTQKAHFYSRSRKKLWLKGESSGHFQEVVDLRLDCDGDSLVVLVKQKGGACHTGYQSCFFRLLKNGTWKVSGRKLFNPEKVYGKK